ncbi:MAG: hypothetical protein LLG06_11615 [Desulfobacteraceae bacterium]|nr:hypothetical protein [Desulfobacteraceae bacterium]
MIRKIVFSVILALCMTACGHKPVPHPPLRMSVDIHSDPSVNNGEVFWMVIKEVDEAQFAFDSYEDIEAIMQSNNWGTDVLAVVAVVPGVPHTISVIRPTYRHAGFYFLFTYEEAYWKVLHKKPAKKCRVHIEPYEGYVTGVAGAF